jgi:hypothetical protein
MADESGTNTNNEQAQTQTQNPPSQQVPTTQQTSQESQSHEQHRPPPFSRELNELRTTLQSLPEAIAMSVASVMPQQQTTSTPPKSSQDTDKTASATNDDAPRSTKDDSPKTPPGKQTFAEWWFGESAGTHRGNG